MPEELSGRELDKALALAIAPPDSGTLGFPNGFPPYHESIDLLLRDVWPVAQARGAQSYALYDGAKRESCAEINTNWPRYKMWQGMVMPGQPALAFARALLAMLTETAVHDA